MSGRIDVHQHVLPPDYRALLRRSGLYEAGGRDLPHWSAGAARSVMQSLGVATGIVSVSTPGVSFLDGPRAISEAAALNDFCADLVREDPGRFGFFATVPLPDVTASAAEAARALDDLAADGVVLLANSGGRYLGEEGQDALFRTLDDRRAVVFVHPSTLPGPTVPGVVPFATDFPLDTTRAAYLLVRNGYVRRFRHVRIVLAHAGGMVPYIAHRMAVSLFAETGRSIPDVLDDFASFYFDTALSSSASALPSLLAFARPGHVLFGSDWPFAPRTAAQYFAAGLDTYPGLDVAARGAVDRTNALALFPRLGSAPPPPAPRARDVVRIGARRKVMRLVSRMTSGPYRQT